MLHAPALHRRVQRPEPWLLDLLRRSQINDVAFPARRAFSHRLVEAAGRHSSARHGTCQCKEPLTGQGTHVSTGAPTVSLKSLAQSSLPATNCKKGGEKEKNGGGPQLGFRAQEPRLTGPMLLSALSYRGIGGPPACTCRGKGARNQ